MYDNKLSKNNGLKYGKIFFQEYSLSNTDLDIK